MLIGEYTHTIDEKSRLSLPSKFRQEMGKKIVMTRGFDRCIFVFTFKEWEKISLNLGEGSASMFQADTRSFNRFLLGGAVETEVDALGRVLVPEFLAEWAGLKNKIAVVGVQSRVEIWNEKAWNEYKRDVEKRADALAEKMGSAGMINL